MIFFLFVQNKKEFRMLHLSFFSSLTFVFFWTLTFFFHAPGGGGISSEKKLQIDDRDIVILSKLFSRRMIWKKKMVFYVRKPNATIWYFHLLCQKFKKKSILKKVGFPSMCLFSRTAFIYKKVFSLSCQIFFFFFLSTMFKVDENCKGF